MSVTSAPIGSTGQSLDGFAVNANVADAFRESVVITDPTDPLAAVRITSTQPISFYGVPVWMQGTPSVAVAGALPNVSSFPLGTTEVFGQVSSFAVNQANPVSTVVVSSVPLALVGTSQIFGQVSTFPHGLTGTSQISGQVSSYAIGTVSTQVVSSLPLWVSQSSAPWSVIGGVNVSSQSAVSSSWPLNTTMVYVVSTVPSAVTQSSAPWLTVLNVSTAGGAMCKTVICGASLNTTVVKNSPGQIYGFTVSNFGSSQAYVKLCNASTAVAASSAALMYLIGMPSSSTVQNTFPVGIEYSTGILMFTVNTPFAGVTGSTGILSSSVVVSLCYE